MREGNEIKDQEVTIKRTRENSKMSSGSGGSVNKKRRKDTIKNFEGKNEKDSGENREEV